MNMNAYALKIGNDEWPEDYTCITVIMVAPDQKTAQEFALSDSEVKSRHVHEVEDIEELPFETPLSETTILTII